MGKKDNLKKRAGGGQDGGPRGRAASPPTYKQLQDALRNAHKNIASLTAQIRRSLEDKERMGNQMQKDKLRIAHLEECVEIRGKQVDAEYGKNYERLRKGEAETERVVHLHSKRMEELKAEHQKKVSQMEDEIQQRDVKILLRDAEILDLCKEKERLAQRSTKVKEKERLAQRSTEVKEKERLAQRSTEVKEKERLAQRSTEVKDKQEDELQQPQHSALEQEVPLLEDRKEDMEKEEEETPGNQVEEKKEEMCVKSRSRWCVFLRRGVAAWQKMKKQKKMKKSEKEEKKHATEEKMEKEKEEESVAGI